MKWKQNTNNVDVPLKEIHPNIKNPRKGSYDKVKMDELKESLSAMGQLNNMTLDEKGIILSGHRRFHAMKEMDWDIAKCDVKVGLSEFDKSAVMICDNATQQKFNAWENRKTISDIYFNEFCEEYEFTRKDEKGYTVFAKKIGISVPQARRCIESMARQNLAIASKLEVMGCTPDIFDEILDTPNKYKKEVMNKAIQLHKKSKTIKSLRTGEPLKRSGMSIRYQLRMFKKSLVAKTATDELKPAFFKIIYSRLDNLGFVLTKKVFEKADVNDKLKLKEIIKKNIIPIWKLLENYKGTEKKSAFD